MSDSEAPAIAVRMGKPPLPMTIRPTKVQLSDELIAAIDERVGTYARSRFIREAIEEKLERSKDAHGKAETT